MTSPYAQVGPRLVELGYSAIPIARKSKFPGSWCGGSFRPMPQWSQFCHRLPTAEEVATWARWPEAGVGVATGPASGVVGLDFDTRPEFWSAVEALIEISPVIKRGKKGYTAFYRYSGEPTKQFIIPGDDVPAIELLAVGRQSVIPPSPHPELEGQCYEWDDASLCDVSAGQLPRLPENIVELLYEILGIDQRVFSAQPVGDAGGLNPSAEMAEEMLNMIPAEVDATTWIRMGASLKSGFPDEVAFDLWNFWSSKDKREWRKGIPQYQPSRMYRRWQGITAQGVTLGTFIKAAEDAGFDDWHFDEDRELAHVSPTLNPRKVETVVVVEPEPAPPVTRSPDPAPGLVGAIAAWICETAVITQPTLALGAALAFVGAMKGRRVRTRTNLRTNIYVLGLGGSGSGKNHPINALEHLHYCVYGENERGILCDRPRSDAALCAEMAEKNGRCLLLWDEIGQEIRAMSNPQSAPHRAGIMTVFTEAFSAASRTIPAQRLASGSRPAVVQPCLCVYGTTVPERFFESLTSGTVIDGFLSRWLVFQCENDWPDENDLAEIFDPPSWVVTRLRELRGAQSSGGISDVPPKIPYSPGAEALYKEIRAEFRERAKRASVVMATAAPIWIRAAEHAAKLALIVTDGPETTEKELQWAKALVDSQCQNMVHLIETRISENEQEKNLKRVLRHVREAGGDGVAKSRLTKLTFDLRKRDRDEILCSLKESGCIKEEDASFVPGEKRVGRPATIYRFIKGV